MASTTSASLARPCWAASRLSFACKSGLRGTSIVTRLGTATGSVNSLSLPLENLPRPLNRIRLVRRLVGPQPHNPRKSQRITAVMTVRLHHVVEGHLQHNLRLNCAPGTLIFNRVFEKPLRHSGNLDIGQS